jgi:hypothetical protein
VVVDLPKPLNRLTCDLSYEEGVLHREMRLPSSNPALQKVSRLDTQVVRTGQNHCLWVAD